MTNFGTVKSDTSIANIFFGYDSAGGTAIDGTERTVPMGTVPLDDSYFSVSGNEITINKTGTYRISAHWWAEFIAETGAARGDYIGKIQKDPLGVGSFADIAYSVAACYVRWSADRFSCSKTFPIELTATDKIRMRVVGGTNTPNLQTRANGSTLSIEFIPR
jgi:hypothetical protein